MIALGMRQRKRDFCAGFSPGSLSTGYRMMMPHTFLYHVEPLNFENIAAFVLSLNCVSVFFVLFVLSHHSFERLNADYDLTKAFELPNHFVTLWNDGFFLGFS